MNQLCACRPVSGALLLTVLWSLFSAPPAHAQQDVRRAVPPPGRALVFIIRFDREPQAAQVPVIVNNELVGQLAHGTFVTATVNPGRTYLRIGERLVSTVSILAAANQSYFVWIEATYGVALVRTEVYLVSESDGRRLLARSRYVGVAPPPVAPPVAAPPAVSPPVAPPPLAAPPAAPPPVVAPAPPAAPPPAPPAPVREAAAPAEPGREWNIALIASAGSFKLANENQVLAGFNSTYDTKSKSVFGVEAEWRGKSGFALGGEIFRYENDLVSTATIPNAKQEVLALMVNAKYYFRAASWLYPFVGAGVGHAKATYSGGFTGDTTGPAYQGMAGVEIRFKPLGLYVQYKYLGSETGDTGTEVKVGGSGVLAGLSLSF